MAKALIKILCLLAMTASSMAFLSSMCDNQPIGSRIAFPLACEKFIVCGESARVASIKTCPSGLHFNAAIEECDLKTKAGCEQSNFWAAADTCDTSTCCACCDCSGCTKCDNDLQYCVGQPNGVYPYPPDCTQYIRCIDECTTVYQCPDRTLYLYETGECGDPCKAVCPNNPYCPTGCANGLDICANSTDGTLIPNYDQCGTYYICKENCAVPEKCPEGQLFNPDTRRCEEACNVKCPGSGYPCTNGCENGSTICENELEGTQLPNPNECGTFYICKNKCPERQRCDEGQLFNPLTLRCEEACNVNCPGSGYPCSGGCEDGSEICINLADGTLIPNDNQCGGFYICKDQCPSPGQCPLNQLFNPETRRCEQACNVNCPGSGYPCSTCSNGIQLCTNSSDGTQIPNPNECGTYYICKDKCAVPEQCPEGQLFNPDTLRCEQACNVKCPGSGYPCSNGCEGGSTICENELEGTQLPNPDKCGVFYVCRDKCPVDGECPEGLLFNPLTRECEKACSVDCPGSGYPCENNCENGLDICENSLDGTQLPNYGECGTYFECQDRCPIVRKCPDGLLFNPVTRKCEKSCNVNCPGSGFPCSGDCENGLDICKDVEDGTLIPNYSVCGTFFVCDKKCPVPRVCTEGQLFNPETLKCEEACLVDCPGSNFPCSKCENGLTACVGKPDGFYPYPNDCTRWIECKRECATVNSCPFGLLWDKDSQKCVPACDISCPTNPYPCDNFCPEGLEICENKPVGSYQPIPEDCSSFAVCETPCKIIKCAEGQLYNPNIQRCDRACSVDCPGSGYPCPNPPPAGPSGHACDSPGMCVDKPDGTLFKDPNSNGYIVCQCECEIPRPCPNGLIFNQSLQTCDWPPKQ